MTKKTRQFIVDTLLPYKENKDNCAVLNNNCYYLDEKGRRCALGKHLKEGEWLSYGLPARNLFKKYTKKILTDEAKSHKISIKIWGIIQEYHDALGLELKPEYLTSALERLEAQTGLKFPELWM